MMLGASGLRFLIVAATLTAADTSPTSLHASVHVGRSVLGTEIKACPKPNTQPHGRSDRPFSRRKRGQHVRGWTELSRVSGPIIGVIGLWHAGHSLRD